MDLNSIRVSKRLLAAAAVIMAVVLAVQALMMYACAEDVSAAQVKKPAKVKITSVRVSGTKITVKWKTAKNAKKYQVYVKVGAIKWKLKKTLKNTSFKMTGKSGTTYRIKVRSVNGKKKGSFSVIKKITLLKKEEPVEPGTDPEQPEQPEEPEHEKTALEIAAFTKDR